MAPVPFSRGPAALAAQQRGGAGLPLYKILATGTEPVTHIRMYASGGEFTWLKGSRFPGPDDLVKALASKKIAKKKRLSRGGTGVYYPNPEIPLESAVTANEAERSRL